MQLPWKWAFHPPSLQLKNDIFLELTHSHFVTDLLNVDNVKDVVVQVDQAKGNIN
jgi:hypothetical protein